MAGGLVDAHMAGGPVLSYLSYLIYTAHMPVFFLFAGPEKGRLNSLSPAISACGFGHPKWQSRRGEIAGGPG
jgi:hypothetical protein